MQCEKSLAWRCITALTATASAVTAPALTRKRRFVHWLWPESGAISPIPALDSLRAIAVLLTIVFHAWYQLPGTVATGKTPYQYPLYFGRTGVHLFFVLSGFLLFLPYAKWILGSGERPSTRLFYKRRLLRVGPAYWVSLIILSVFGPYTISALLDVVAHVFFASNVYYRTIFSINGVYWTMAIEVQYYLVLPLIAFALFWLSKRVGVWVSLLGLVGALLVVSAASIKIDDTHALGHIAVVSTLLLGETSLTAWIGVFGLGIAMSMLYSALKNSNRLESLHLAGNALVPLSIALGFGLAFAPIAQSDVKHIGFGVVYTLLLAGVLFASPRVRRVFEWRVLRFIGLISYSLYIWHLFVIEKIDRLLPKTPLSLRIESRLVVGGLLSIAVAYVSYQLVERPFIRARRRAHEAVAVNPP